MRRGNLPVGGHDILTWRLIRDLLTRFQDNITGSYSSDIPQRHHWVVHLRLAWDAEERYS